MYNHPAFAAALAEQRSRELIAEARSARLAAPPAPTVPPAMAAMAAQSGPRAGSCRAAGAWHACAPPAPVEASDRTRRDGRRGPCRARGRSARLVT